MLHTNRSYYAIVDSGSYRVITPLSESIKDLCCFLDDLDTGLDANYYKVIQVQLSTSFKVVSRGFDIEPV